MAISKDGKSGGWRYPRTEGAKVWTNQILHSVVTATCCEGNTCGDTGCQCKDIIDEESFKKCVCADGWTNFGGRCYKHCEIKKNWNAAEFTCKSWRAGAHLASVHSKEEQDFIQKEFPYNIWLGGNDWAKERAWVWSDRSEFHFKDWYKGEPNNLGRAQHCLLGNWDEKQRKQWDDENCSIKFKFLCKY